MRQEQIQEAKKDHEKEHGCKVHASSVKGEEIDFECFPIYRSKDGPELSLDIWNMSLRSVKVNDQFRSEFAEKVPQELLDTIVYDENQGAINMSGWYYPQTKRSYDELFRIIKKCLCDNCRSPLDPKWHYTLTYGSPPGIEVCDNSCLLDLIITEFLVGEEKDPEDLKQIISSRIDELNTFHFETGELE